MSVTTADLIGHKFIKDLAEEYLVELLKCGATERRYEEDTVIFREGDPATEFHLIQNGFVALEATAADSRPLTIVTLEGGEVLGWSWMFPPYRWYFGARALTATRTIALNGELVRTACQLDTHLGYELTRRIARVVVDRLQATRLQALDLYGQSERK